MTEVVVTTGAVRRAKLRIITTNKPTSNFFTGWNALPVTEPTVTEHCRYVIINEEAIITADHLLCISECNNSRRYTVSSIIGHDISFVILNHRNNNNRDANH